MPIPGVNIVQISGVALRPAPKFTIDTQPHMCGEYIIGGLIIVKISGELFGNDLSDLQTKIKAKTDLSGTCQSFKISCGDSTLFNIASALIKDVNITPTDQPFNANYSFSVIIDTIDSKSAIIPDKRFLDYYKITVPSGINLLSYDESLAVSPDSIGQVAITASGTFKKFNLKVNGSIDIQAYGKPCDTTTTDDVLAALYTIINTRAVYFLSNNTAILKETYPFLEDYDIDDDWLTMADTKSLTIDPLTYKISWSFDLLLYKQEEGSTCYSKAIVSINTTDTIDQMTYLSTFNIKGTINGLSDITVSSIDNKVLSSEKLNNARTAYDLLKTSPNVGDYYRSTISGCGPSGSLPPNFCYQITRSSITESLNTGEITFDLQYADAETCQLGGMTIDVTLSEDRPAYKHVEFIIPGRATSLVQVGFTLTPYKVTLTVSGKVNNTCNTSLASGALRTCVLAKYVEVKNLNNFQNLLELKYSESQGSYSFKVTDERIDCVT